MGKPMERIITKLAGVTHRDAQENIKALVGRDHLVPLTLVREPDNPEDPNAIRVDYEENYAGYVPATEAVRLG